VAGRVIISRTAAIITIVAAVATLAVALVTAVGAVPGGAPLSRSESVASSALVSSALAPSVCPGTAASPFGANVCVFSDKMSQARIQSDLNAIAARQVPAGSQFTSRRYALLFEPGTYGSAADPLVFQVGYYTGVAGLGSLPRDTVINGAADVFNDLCSGGSCNADDNFWRSLSNLTLNVHLPKTPPAYAPKPADPDGAGCDNSAEFWAVSQAAPLRRVVINGNVAFQDYCAPNDFASGGFIADSQITGKLGFYGNQQYLVRNSSIGGTTGCPNGLWNMVYAGVKGAPRPVFTGQCQQNTVLSTSPVTGEEPFLYTGAGGGYRVFVPAVRTRSSGTSWAGGSEAGESLPLSSFFVAAPATPVAAINSELAAGKNLVLTPGVYDLPQPISVGRPNTVILGQGFATLVPQRGNAALTVASDVGVKVSGLIIDAGHATSPVLFSLGHSGPATAGNPDLISDVFFRIGGAETTSTSATVSLLDGAPHSIIDDVWAWRADHGNDVGWTANVAATGVEVTGNDVTAYGLAVEHYQKSEVTWTGQGGTDVFFQNELPYDPPSQAAWRQSATRDGYPAFQVGAGVKTFTGDGMGSYVVFIDTKATLHDAAAFEAPKASGIQFHDVFGVWIAGSGGLDSVINGVGGPVSSTSPGKVVPVDVASYRPLGHFHRASNQGAAGSS
jgi:hypothetical protein